MNNSKTLKTIVVRGNDAFKAFSENGVLQTPESLSSFTPITFYDIKAGQDNVFILAENLNQSYQTTLVTVNLNLDDIDLEIKIATDRSAFQGLMGIQIIKNDKKIQHHWLNVSDGNRSDLLFFLRPDEQVQIDSNVDANSLTFWCKSVFIESEITLKKLPEDS